MVAAAVVGVAVVADPSPRRAGLVLRGFGERGEAVDVIPAATRAGNQVHGEAERVLAVGGVSGGGVAVGDLRVEGLDDPQQVGQDPLVDQLAGLARESATMRPPPTTR